MADESSGPGVFFLFQLDSWPYRELLISTLLLVRETQLYGTRRIEPGISGGSTYGRPRRITFVVRVPMILCSEIQTASPGIVFHQADAREHVGKPYQALFFLICSNDFGGGTSGVRDGMQGDVPFDILDLPHRAAVGAQFRYLHSHAGGRAALQEIAQHPFHEGAHLQHLFVGIGPEVQ